jgi:hypothetical protein
MRDIAILNHKFYDKLLHFSKQYSVEETSVIQV